MYAVAALVGSLAVTPISEDLISANVAFFAIGVILFAISGYMLRRRKMVPDGYYDETLTDDITTTARAPGQPAS